MEFLRYLKQVAASALRATMVPYYNLLPLGSARKFWQKMGYSPHPQISRVMTKTIAPTGPPRVPAKH